MEEISTFVLTTMFPHDVTFSSFTKVFNQKVWFSVYDENVHIGVTLCQRNIGIFRIQDSDKKKARSNCAG